MSRYRRPKPTINQNPLAKISMMGWIWIFVAIFTASFAFYGNRFQERREAEANAPGTRTEVVSDIVAVAMHEPGSYSAIQLLPNKTMKTILLCREIPCTLVADVPADKPLSMTYKVNDYGYKSAGVLHIHGAASIIGGGWKQVCGKMCQRDMQTQIIDGTP
jgi:hypothetical protein